MLISLRRPLAVVCLTASILCAGCSDPLDHAGASVPATSEAVSDDSVLGLNRQSDPLERAAAVAAMLDAADESRVPDAREALLSPGANRLDAVETAIVVRFWARHEPEQAADWAKQSPDAAYRDQMVRDVFDAWAQREVDAAISGVWEVANETVRSAALEGLVRGWFLSGQEGLDDFVRDLGPTEDRQRVLATIARLRILAEGPESLMAWAEQQNGDRAFRSSVIRRTGGALASERPDLAREWCERYCDGQFGGSLRQFIATAWAKRDGRAMMEWLSQSPEGIETEVAVRAGYRKWILTDHEAAYSWVDALPEERRRDPRLQSAVGMYISRIAWRAHEKALEWTSYLADPDERRLARVSALRRWLHREPEAAEAWLLDQTVLKPEDIAEARRIPDSWKALEGQRVNPR